MACTEAGFQNVTRILCAQVPVLKLTDPSTGLEVDLCVNNRLGLRNTELLKAYVAVDPRVAQLGKIIKNWAKWKEIVGKKTLRIFPRLDCYRDEGFR